ncbi:hypothetical protein FJ938_27055 [Mesorhizobium sp. B2-4-14]|nr:hypothetical protein FJ938_27055 [Mesorhizobium sp. B2-4-14]
MPPVLMNLAIRRIAPGPQQKPDCTFVQPGNSPEVARKNWPRAGVQADDLCGAKVSPDREEISRKSSRTWQACKCCTAQLSRFTYIGSRGGPIRSLNHGFLH